MHLIEQPRRQYHSEKLVSLLQQNTHGLNIHELLDRYFQNYQNHSFQLQFSMRKRMEKIIQRSRQKMKMIQAEITIFYDTKEKKYKLSKIDLED